jgi:hypothetical protein
MTATPEPEPLVQAASEMCPCRTHVDELMPRLPPSDEALHDLMAGVVERRQERAFTMLLATALAAGRRVDAELLVNGASLLPDPYLVALAAGHCQGEVADALVRAVQSGRSGWERTAVMLLLAAWWTRRQGAEIPTELIRQARLLGRKRLGPTARLGLEAAAQEVDDPGLTALVEDLPYPPPADAVTAFANGITAIAEGTLDDILPESPEPTALSGYTVRRAVAKVGRNDPCPCGSGRKYKRCCAEADRRRLRDSSDVPGLTRAELRRNLAEHLTFDRLLDLRSHDLVTLDPAKVPEDLRGVYLNQLLAFNELEAVLRFFEEVGVPPELEGHVHDAMMYAADDRRADVVSRLLEIAGDSFDDDDVPVSVKLWQLDVSTPGLALLESEARRCVDDHVVDFAHELLTSDAPALGILVARGAAAISSHIDREVLVDSLLEARDRLDLAPDDPVEDLVFELNLLEDRTSEVLEAREEVAAAREGVTAKTDEIKGLRAEVARLKGELASRERVLERAHRAPRDGEEGGSPEKAPDQSGNDDHRLQELRRRVKTMREQLVARHNERNALRRQLRALEEAPSPPQEEGAHAPPLPSEPDDETTWIEDDSPATHGLRIPTFAPGFAASLESRPDPAARAALALVGQLAAGTHAAFRGARRLRQRRSIWRQKVGRDHRLLFRLEGDELEVLALVHRQDLDTALRKLG